MSLTTAPRPWWQPRLALFALTALLLTASGCERQRPAPHAPLTAEQLSAYTRWSADRTPMISAHRGGPQPGYPENSLAAFERSLEFAPVIIELDVARSADSVLVLMHDSLLNRSTTGSGPVSSLRYEELRELRLIDSEGDTTVHGIPSFDEALAWARGRAILMVDVKRSAPFEAVVAAIDNAEAEGYAAVISYNADHAELIHQLDDELLISAVIRNEADLQRLLERGIPAEKLIAFVGLARPDRSLLDLLHGQGILCIVGTMGNLDRRAELRGAEVYVDLWQHGVDVLSTDNVPLAAKALRSLAPEAFTGEGAR